MGHTLKIYLRLIGVQIRSQMQYRFSFIMDVLATLFITFFEFGSLVLVLQRFETLDGWTVMEVALLVGSVEISFGMMDMVFSGFDPAFFGRFVRKGAFDQLLLRPINITIQVMGAEFATRRLGRIFIGCVIFGTAVTSANVAWTPAKLLIIPIMLLSMFLFFGGLFMIGATFSFWTVESLEAMNVLTYGGSYSMSHPMSVYQNWLRHFFTFVIPAIFLNYYPVLMILEKPDPFNMPSFAPFLSPAVGSGFITIALLFWRFGIQHYQSTGT